MKRILLYVFILISLPFFYSFACSEHLEKIRLNNQKELSRKIFGENFFEKINNSNAFNKFRTILTDFLVVVNNNSFKYLYLNQDMSHIKDVYQAVYLRALEEANPEKYQRFANSHPEKFELFKNSFKRINDVIIKYKNLDGDMTYFMYELSNFESMKQALSKARKDKKYFEAIEFDEFDLDSGKTVKRKFPAFKFEEGLNKTVQAKRADNALKDAIRKLSINIERYLSGEVNSIEGRHIEQFIMQEQLKLYYLYANDVAHRVEELKGFNKHTKEIDDLLNDKSLKPHPLVSRRMKAQELYQEFDVLFKNKIEIPREEVRDNQKYSYGSTLMDLKFIPDYKIGNDPGTKVLFDKLKRVVGFKAVLASSGVLLTSASALFYYKYFALESEKRGRCFEHLDPNNKDAMDGKRESRFQNCRNDYLINRFGKKRFLDFFENKSQDEKLEALIKQMQLEEKIYRESIKSEQYFLNELNRLFK